MRIEDINFFYINCKIDSIKNESIINQWNECWSILEDKIEIERRDAVHFRDYSYPYFTECFQPTDSVAVPSAMRAIFFPAKADRQ